MTTELPAQPPPVGSYPMSWWAEIVKGTPGHLIMAGLFVYWLLYVTPTQQAMFDGRLVSQREAFLHSLDQQATRHETAMQDLQTNCYELARGAIELSRKNNELLVQQRTLLQELVAQLNREGPRRH